MCTQAPPHLASLSALSCRQRRLHNIHAAIPHFKTFRNLHTTSTLQLLNSTHHTSSTTNIRDTTAQHPSISAAQLAFRRTHTQQALQTPHITSSCNGIEPTSFALHCRTAHINHIISTSRMISTLTSTGCSPCEAMIMHSRATNDA
jgi:O-acetylhomoserine/O-acetylserine sulfhydrylase-like pyridoxal-dependent enzyme